ncbi:hypothetical protein PCANC_03156 [Puccinia coronata f. sp. avenae]|uniref:Uncharacterized protein n=1 Tax=Puccinia coronata f. sp. avenae TaxID=200324 RepID=A0A2N5T866_9BASI|nr:hypothetical protein PCANC_03156 [Puccinia coronata f. sp. avenae]
MSDNPVMVPHKICTINHHVSPAAATGDKIQDCTLIQICLYQFVFDQLLLSNNVSSFITSGQIRAGQILYIIH